MHSFVLSLLIILVSKKKSLLIILESKLVLKKIIWKPLNFSLLLK